MTSFFGSPECRSGTHCRTCRDRDAGRSFRAAVAAYFSLPTVAPQAAPKGDVSAGGTAPALAAEVAPADAVADFDCPHGRLWHAAGPFPAIAAAPRTNPPPADQEAEREYAEEIRATCARCPQVDTCELGQLARRRPCEARTSFQAGASCPTGAVSPWSPCLAAYSQDGPAAPAAP